MAKTAFTYRLMGNSKGLKILVSLVRFQLAPQIQAGLFHSEKGLFCLKWGTFTLVVCAMRDPAAVLDLKKEDSMILDVYVNYKGNCREAFNFYQEHLDGKITSLTIFGQMAEGADFPAEWKEKIMHARIEIGGTVLMGADVPTTEPMRSVYLTLRFDSAEETERIYELLSDGGEVFMKMQQTAFAARFAMLRDRFGASWMLLYQKQ
jgi:PhnB protein